MKILTIAATPFFSDRGCHIRIYNGAKYLEKFGAKVKICTYFNGENVAGLDIDRIKKVGWYKKTSPGFSWGKFWLDIKLIFLCRKAIRAFRPDIIHAHMYEGLGIGYIARVLAFRNIPVVVDLQADLDEEFRNYSQNYFIARRIFVWLSRRLVNRCNWLVLSSENLMPKMKELFGCGDKIAIIRDGMDLDLFRNVPKLYGGEEEKIEKIKKWKGGKKLLVYIGGLSDNKGVGKLLESFKKLTLELGSRVKDWKLLIGGFGSDEEKYKKFVAENNLSNLVCFIGRVRYFSLPVYLALADAAVDPKNGSTESSGKLVSYMAARLPIICFDNEFNRARLREKGYYFQRFDELAEVLERIPKGLKIEYDLENVSEEKETRKLFEVFRLIVKTDSY